MLWTSKIDSYTLLHNFKLSTVFNLIDSTSPMMNFWMMIWHIKPIRVVTCQFTRSTYNFSFIEDIIWCKTNVLSFFKFYRINNRNHIIHSFIFFIYYFDLFLIIILSYLTIFIIFKFYDMLVIWNFMVFRFIVIINIFLGNWLVRFIGWMIFIVCAWWQNKRLQFTLTKNPPWRA